MTEPATTRCEFCGTPHTDNRRICNEDCARKLAAHRAQDLAAIQHFAEERRRKGEGGMSDEQSMVERVARAIWAERVRHARESNGIELEDIDQTIFFAPATDESPRVAEVNNIYGEARAAIEAMREPTAAMAEAGNEVGHDCLNYSLEPGEGIDSFDMRPAWQAMIDRALKEAK